MPVMLKFHQTASGMGCVSIKKWITLRRLQDLLPFVCVQENISIFQQTESFMLGVRLKCAYHHEKCNTSHFVKVQENNEGKVCANNAEIAGPG